MTSKKRGEHWAHHKSEHMGGVSADGRVSDGFALLNAERPDVLRASLDLRSLLGESLSPKTRELIRLATHAERGSQSALRATVPRALAEGATQDQLIDTILLLLPDSGLRTVLDGLGVVAEFLEPDRAREIMGDEPGKMSEKTR